MGNTLKYFSLLVFGVATFWSCQDDNLSQNHNHSHSAKEPVFKTLSLSDIPNLGNKISNLKSEALIRGMSYRTISNETNYFDLIIPYNVNSFVYDQVNNLHHYTFALNIEETNTKTNLVAKETLSGEYEYHIFVFKPDDYQEWYNAIKNSDINYNKSTDFEAFELGEPENTTYSMCLEAVEVWTCPWGIHTLGKDKWYECDSFGPGGGGINSWVRSYTYEMVTCGGGFGGGSSPVIPSDPNNPSNPNPGGGGGNGSGAIPNLTEPDPCVMSASVSFVDLLNDVQKAWWNSSTNTTERNQIQNFLGENGCNQGDTDFAKEIINALILGGEVDFYRKIIYLVNKPCQNQILQDVISTDSPFTNLIRDIFGNDNVANIRFSNGALSGNAAVSTSPEFYGTSESYIISIKFDNDYLDNATNLSIAASVLHELVHAHLMYLFLNNQLVAQNSSYQSLMDAFLNFYKDRDEMTFNELDDEMHNAMSDYIQKMANSIYNYAQSNNIPNVSVDYCVALAWSTMQGYDLFNDVLTNQQQQNYSQIGYDEQNNTGNKKGSGCP